jgi:hypothetical protein
MTTPETFVSRWARLKRYSGRRRAPEACTDAPTLSTSEAPTAGRAEAEISRPPSDAATADVPIEPAGLPSIEAITVNTDIRGFLQSGVPAELARAALRQAWASDPAIRDFIGIAENQWDFNDPNAIPGFGPQPAQDSAAARLAQAAGRHDNIAGIIREMPLEVEPPLRTPTHPESNEPGPAAQPTFDVSPPVDIGGSRENSSGEDAAGANDPAAEGQQFEQKRRRHGSALPR